MKTISSTVNEILATRPFVVEHIRRDLINLSALAREIQNEVEKEVGEKVSRESITMALSRYSPSQSETDQHPENFIGDITLQTGLSVLCFKSDDFYQAIEGAVAELNRLDEFFVITKGINFGGLITRTALIDKLCINEAAVLETEDNLVGVTVKLLPGHEPVLGVCAYIVSLVSQNGVNLEEIISTKDEMTLVIKEQYANLACDILINASNKS